MKKEKSLYRFEWCPKRSEKKDLDVGEVSQKERDKYGNNYNTIIIYPRWVT